MKIRKNIFILLMAIPLLLTKSNAQESKLNNLLKGNIISALKLKNEIIKINFKEKYTITHKGNKLPHQIIEKSGSGHIYGKDAKFFIIKWEEKNFDKSGKLNSKALKEASYNGKVFIKKLKEGELSICEIYADSKNFNDELSTLLGRAGEVTASKIKSNTLIDTISLLDDSDWKLSESLSLNEDLNFKLSRRFNYTKPENMNASNDYVVVFTKDKLLKHFSLLDILKGKTISQNYKREISILSNQKLEINDEIHYFPKTLNKSLYRDEELLNFNECSYKFSYDPSLNKVELSNFFRAKIEKDSFVTDYRFGTSYKASKSIDSMIENLESHDN